MNGDENYQYANDCYGKTIDSRNLAVDSGPNLLEHFDFAMDADEDRYCMRVDAYVPHIWNRTITWYKQSELSIQQKIYLDCGLWW